MVAALSNIFGRKEMKEFSERTKKEAYTTTNCVREDEDTGKSLTATIWKIAEDIFKTSSSFSSV